MDIRLVGAILCLLLLSGCDSTVKISSDHQADVDFSSLKTYRWRDANRYHTDSIKYLNNDILDSRIKAVVDSEFKGKRYALKPEGAVDFLVSYSVTTQEKADIRNYNTYNGVAPGFGYGAYYGRGYRYGGVGISIHNDVDVVYYKEGTFVLDILSADTDKLLWRSSAEGRLHKNKSAEERQESLRTIVADMLAQFPPPPAK